MTAVSGDDVIAMTNGEAGRLFGYRLEEWLGPPVEILPPGQLRGQRARQYDD